MSKNPVKRLQVIPKHLDYEEHTLDLTSSLASDTIALTISWENLVYLFVLMFIPTHAYPILNIIIKPMNSTTPDALHSTHW